MLGSLTRGGGENVPGMPGACATRNIVYLVRGPCVNELMTKIREIYTQLMMIYQLQIIVNYRHIFYCIQQYNLLQKSVKLSTSVFCP